MQGKQQQDSFLQLDNLYASQAQPYETLVEAIMLQNKKIYELTHKHQQLTQQCEQVKLPPLSQQFQNKLQEARKSTLKEQRNLLVEQALQFKQQQYDAQFTAKKRLILEEIYLKYHQICMIRKGRQQSTNLFMHIDDQLFSKHKLKSLSSHTHKY